MPALTVDEVRVEEANASAKAKFEAEYEKNREVFQQQGITKERYVESRYLDEPLPTALATPDSYEGLVKALAVGKSVDKRRREIILELYQRTEAELAKDVINS